MLLRNVENTNYLSVHYSKLEPSLDFYIVDVFAQRRYAGNQLAVFPNASALDTQQMQQIAREINFSETTFITGTSADGAYSVRIFTPVEELPFAGHPTLGTAYVIQHQILRQPIDAVTLNMTTGSIAVQLQYDQDEQLEQLWMRQNPPIFGAEFTPEQLAPVLGIDVSAIDMRLPIQIVSTGLPFILVPLCSAAILAHLDVNLPLYYQLIADCEAKALFVFAPAPTSRECDFSARMFADALGIVEDPATGSANGCFAGYLVQHRYLERNTIAVTVSQGVEMGRPSVLYLRGAQVGEQIQVEVGGEVILVAQGQFV